MASAFVVLLPTVQVVLLSALRLLRLSKSPGTAVGMPVISPVDKFKILLEIVQVWLLALLRPMISHAYVKKTTPVGARSSCNVQPRRNHSLRWKSCITAYRPALKDRTSGRYAIQCFAALYHLHIGLIDSDTSALLFLSMQHVSIHIQSLAA